MIELLTPEQAVERLHISPRTLRSLKAAGALPYVAISARRVLYRASDLEAYIERSVRQEAPPVDSKRQGRVTVRRQQRSDIIPFSQRNRYK